MKTVYWAKLFNAEILTDGQTRQR